MGRGAYKVLAEGTPITTQEERQGKGVRDITWGSEISEAKKGKPFELAGWNRGLTKETSESVAKVANDKERSEKIRQKMLGRKITWADKISITKKKQMQDPEYVRRIFTACGTRPNKPEKKLTALLNRHFPKEWKYVGIGELVIGGKNPDFTNINGKKQLIELNGEYWHQNDDPEERIAWFKKYGYDTLIIWTKELKDEEAVIQKVRDFSECRGHTPAILTKNQEDKDMVRHCLKGQVT